MKTPMMEKIPMMLVIKKLIKERYGISSCVQDLLDTVLYNAASLSRKEGRKEGKYNVRFV